MNYTIKTCCFLCCFFVLNYTLGKTQDWSCKNIDKCLWYLNDENKPMPWYFEHYKVEKAWEKIEGKGDKTEVTVYVLDSKINFDCPALNGKEVNTTYYMGNQTIQAYKEVAKNDPKEYHGTAMAALIAADHKICKCDTTQEDYCNPQKKIVINGIAPDTKIINMVRFPKGDLQEAIRDSVKPPNTIPITINNKLAYTTPETEYQKGIKILNLSGGTEIKIKPNETDEDFRFQKSNWITFIETQINVFPNTLFIAAVGNKGEQITKKDKKCIIPACLIWKNKAISNHIMRVGAIDHHKLGYDPQKLPRSNYGKIFTNIMAPGYTSSIDSSCKGMIAIGTSAAAAIVSGTIALMVYCSGPDIEAQEIREILLNTATESNHLSDEMAERRVLDIYKAVEKSCDLYYNEDIADSEDDLDGEPYKAVEKSCGLYYNEDIADSEDDEDDLVDEL